MPQDMPNPEHGERSQVDQYLSDVHNEHSEVLSYVGDVLDFVQVNFDGAHLIHDGTIKATAAIGLANTIELESGHRDYYRSALGVLVTQTLNASKKRNLRVVRASSGLRGPSVQTTEFDDRLANPLKVLNIFNRTFEACIPDATKGKTQSARYRMTAEWNHIAGSLEGQIRAGKTDFIPPYPTFKKK